MMISLLWVGYSQGAQVHGRYQKNYTDTTSWVITQWHNERQNYGKGAVHIGAGVQK